MNDFLIKFVIIGDSQVGKTALLKNNIEPFHPTIGVDFFSTVIALGNINCKLHVWDTSGNPMFLNLNRTYFNISVGVIIVFDITRRESFSNIDFWINEIYKENNNYRSLVFVGTHADKARQVSLPEIEIKCSKYNADYYEIPGLYNINNILIQMSRDIMNDYNTRPSIFQKLPGFKEERPKNISPFPITSDYILFDEPESDEKGCCERCVIQ